MSVEISTKEADIVAQDATLAQKEFELVSRNAVLERQSSTVQGLSEQLTRAREILSKEKPQVTIDIKQVYLFYPNLFLKRVAHAAWICGYCWCRTTASLVPNWE